MVKETVTCENIFTGEEETVDLYFHLTEAELTLLNISSNNKYANFNEKKERSYETDVLLFTKLIETAYGQKTDDGQFIKDETAKKAFLCSPAFSALLEKFISGEINIGNFVLGCLPKKISSQMTINEDGTVSVKGQK